jgi:hypothetical protein
VPPWGGKSGTTSAIIERRLGSGETDRWTDE